MTSQEAIHSIVQATGLAAEAIPLQVRCHWKVTKGPGEDRNLLSCDASLVGEKSWRKTFFVQLASRGKTVVSFAFTGRTAALPAKENFVCLGGQSHKVLRDLSASGIGGAGASQSERRPSYSDAVQSTSPGKRSPSRVRGESATPGPPASPVKR